MRRPAALIVICAGLLALLLPGHAAAGWPTDANIWLHLCTYNNNQQVPAFTADGAGGVFAVWRDYRSRSVDIYAQKASADGTLLWTSLGAPVCTAPNSQNFPAIVSDGAGGAIVVWDDPRSGVDYLDYASYDIYAQRISAEGAPLWTANGVAICTALGAQMRAAITTDGDGGAIITWQDARSRYWDVYAQRISAEGVPLWTVDGVALCTAPGGWGTMWDLANHATIVSDGLGGAIVSWQDARSDLPYALTWDIYAQRVSPDGTPLWTADGVALCTDPANQTNPAIVVPTVGDLAVAGEAIVTWLDKRSGNWAIYTRRIGSDGTLQWATDGVLLSNDAYSSGAPDIASDREGGAFITWCDNSSVYSYYSYAQRIASDGSPRWPVNGVPLCTASGEQSDQAIVADGAGGAIVSWRDWRDYPNNSSLYAQRISSDGALVWTASGVPIAIGCGPILPQIVSDGTGGAIIGWQGGTYISFVWAQRVAGDGGLGNHIDWADLHEPSTLTTTAGVASDQIFGQVWIDGVTSQPGATAGLVAELGFGPDGSDPSVTPTVWQWTAASYNLDDGANDEFEARLTALDPGTYDYAYRYSYTGGQWVYADLDGSANGYSPEQAGSLTVDAAMIGWCNLQGPPTLTVPMGMGSDLVYGQVWIDGITVQPGPTPEMTVELGYGPDESDPSMTPDAWQWTAALFNLDADANDEFAAWLAVPAPGTYDYAYRYSYNGGAWVYGDLDGSMNGYSPSQAGNLTVTVTTAVPGVVPTVFRLYPNQPNPFNPITTIRFDLPAAGPVRLAVYDVAGRLVKVLVEGERVAGSFEAVWDGRDASGRSSPSGSYLARLVAGGKVEVVRMGLVR